MAKQLHERRMKPSEKKVLAKRRDAAHGTASSTVSRDTGRSPVSASTTARPTATRVKGKAAPVPRGAPLSDVPLPWDMVTVEPATVGVAAKPADKVKPAAANTEPAPSNGKLVAFVDDTDLADCLPELAEEYRSIQDQLPALEARKKELSALIMPLLAATGLDVVMGPGWVVVKAKGKSPRISAEKLMGRGVTVDVIKACTDDNAYEYVQVRRPGKDE